jgi:hypothetical protein
MAFTFGLPWVKHWLQGGSRQRKRRPLPPRRTAVRQTCRLELEPLEDRLTPCFHSCTFPIAHVVVNPQPLPPSVAIEIDSMPNLPALTAGTSSQQEHIAGFLSKQITFQPAASTTSAPDPTNPPWLLHVSYSLNVSETANVVLPTALNGGSLWASFSIFGTWRAILVPVAPTTGTTWLINNATIKEQGSIWGALNMPSATAPAVDTFMWTTQISENGTETPLMVPTGLPTGPIQMPVNFQANIQSSGMVMEIPPEPIMPAPTAASFWQQDQLTESFNGTGGIAVQPSIMIAATFNAAGSVTENQLIPQIAFIPVVVDTGSVQYTESITLTITMPDGMQTATESSQNIGMFGVILIVVL